jgi:hypothetical protein
VYICIKGYGRRVFDIPSFSTGVRFKKPLVEWFKDQEKEGREGMVLVGR